MHLIRKASYQQAIYWLTLSLTVLASSLTVSISALAATATSEQATQALTEAKQRGYEIARLADMQDLGYSDMQVNVKMILLDAMGRRAERSLAVSTLEMTKDGDRSLTLFLSPRDQKGTALLTHAHPQASDDQWLYLPALRRVKRITAHDRSGPFVGSEFAYEDMIRQEVDDYSYRLLKSAQIEGKPAWLLERTPKDAHSGYSKQHVWLDKQAYRIWRIDFYDRKHSLLKTLFFEDYQQYANAYWRPLRSIMENHQTGKKTILEYSGYHFKNGLTTAQFSQYQLRNQTH
ncbi:outer membrane lipoprotein-sorting protein [Zooshikella ganghwensis]|uniref:Outer membrane lipoprotein-sorting protein n=1 Tax=Zooshikella ganghwensis TaxID=202772 RepID=A0A4V1IN09_9GAMM|nr:outer membrane lipoprotein-sorting protein [Zooshikella ganghwensis]RDH42091.1 outer membrane lipoprotein-sorting protein [Zooshikella ganghwensis]